MTDDHVYVVVYVVTLDATVLGVFANMGLVRDSLEITYRNQGTVNVKVFIPNRVWHVYVDDVLIPDVRIEMQYVRKRPDHL